MTSGSASDTALDALLDPAQPLVLFAWLTNRSQPWLGPFADDATRHAAYDQVPMGYTSLWLLRRVGVWRDGVWRWDDEQVPSEGNHELVAFDRSSPKELWRGSRFEDPVTVLVEGRDPADPVALLLLEQSLTWH